MGKKTKGVNNRQSGGIDFIRAKKKVGKKIKKHANVTDTTVRAKRINLPGQTVGTEGKGEPLTHRGLSISELLNQTSHYSEKVRKDALEGMRELLEAHPETMKGSAAAVVEKTAERLVDREQIVRIAARGALKHGVLPALGKRGVAPFAKRLVLHVGAALTHVDPVTRRDAPAALETLLDAAPELVAAHAPAATLRHLADLLRRGDDAASSALDASASATAAAAAASARRRAARYGLSPAFGDMTASRVGASTPGARFRLLTACRRFLETLVSLSIDHGHDDPFSLKKKARERTTFAPFAVRDEALFDEALADDRFDVGAETRATHAFRLARPPLDAATAVLDAFGGGKASRAAEAERDDGGAGVPAAAADLAALCSRRGTAAPALRAAGGGGADGGTHMDLLVKTKAMTEALVCTRLALRLVDRADARARGSRCGGGRRAGALAARMLGGGASRRWPPRRTARPSAGRSSRTTPPPRRCFRRPPTASARSSTRAGRSARWRRSATTRDARRTTGPARTGPGRTTPRRTRRRSPTRSPTRRTPMTRTADHRMPFPTRSTRARRTPRPRPSRRTSRARFEASRWTRVRAAKPSAPPRATTASSCAPRAARSRARRRSRARARRGAAARGARAELVDAVSEVWTRAVVEGPPERRAACVSLLAAALPSAYALRDVSLKNNGDVSQPGGARSGLAESAAARWLRPSARALWELKHRDPATTTRLLAALRAVASRATAERAPAAHEALVAVESELAPFFALAPPPSADPDAPRVPAKLGPFARLPPAARFEAIALLGCLPALSPATIRAVAHAALAPAAAQTQTEEKKRKRNGSGGALDGKKRPTTDDVATRAVDAVAANVAAAPLALSTSFFAAVLTGAPEWDRAERVAGAAARALVDLGGNAWAGAGPLGRVARRAGARVDTRGAEGRGARSAGGGGAEASAARRRPETLAPPDLEEDVPRLLASALTLAREKARGERSAKKTPNREPNRARAEDDEDAEDDEEESLSRSALDGVALRALRAAPRWAAGTFSALAKGLAAVDDDEAVDATRAAALAARASPIFWRRKRKRDPSGSRAGRRLEDRAALETRRRTKRRTRKRKRAPKRASPGFAPPRTALVRAGVPARRARARAGRGAGRPGCV